MKNLENIIRINYLIEFIDMIIRIFGIFSIMSIIYKLIKKRKSWSQNVTIKRIKDKRELDNYRYYFEEGDINIESTIIAPINEPLTYIRIYEIVLKRNKLKKKRLKYSYNNIEPGGALIIHEPYSTIPSVMICIKNKQGGIATVFISENGFNGNTDYVSIEFKYGILNLLFSDFL